MIIIMQPFSQSVKYFVKKKLFFLQTIA